MVLGLGVGLLGRVLGLVVRHFEVVVVVLAWKPSQAGFRCALLDGRLVLLRGQLWCFVGGLWVFSLFKGAVRWSGALWSSFAI